MSLPQFNIPAPDELKATTQSMAKIRKFDELMKLQLKYVKTNMENGHNWVNCIFCESGYFITPLEKTWKEEFEAEAKSQFAAAGYIIKNDIIAW